MMIDLRCLKLRLAYMMDICAVQVHPQRWGIKEITVIFRKEIFGEMFDMDAIITEDLNLRKNFHTVFFIDINFQ